jgi:uncharacterized protein
MHFLNHSLLSTIEVFYEKGYRRIILDEVHRYTSWSIELKNLYDGFPDVQFLGTSSSAFDIMKGESDLSRRADVYLMHGLSFREYMLLMHGLNLPAFEFEYMLTYTESIAEKYYDAFHIKKYFAEYLKYGYYPFIKEGKARYYEKVLAALHQTIDIDLPAVFRLDYNTSRQVKRFLALLATIVPFEPNLCKMARDLETNRVSLLTYIDYLSLASVLNLLKSANKSDSIMTKPDKILLSNTNMVYALSPDVNAGTLRETFVLSALKAKHKVSTPAKGDLLLDSKYTIEIGGPNKRFHQIADMANPVLIQDGVTLAGNGTLPMWMLGLLH